MDVVEPPVSTGLISIYDKCGKRMKADSTRVASWWRDSRQSPAEAFGQ